MFTAMSRIPVSQWILAGLSAAAIGLFTQPVVADEAYLCGPDSVIYVSVADLPKMKRTNACIAAYYGLKIEASEEQPLQTAEKPSLSGAKPSTIPVKAQRKNAAAHAVLKPLLEPEASGRASAAQMRQASLARPTATPGTDYRNVKIINATSDEDAVFRHTR